MSVNDRTSKANKRNRAARSSQLKTTVSSNTGSFVSAGAILYYDINERRCYPGVGTTVFDLTGNRRNMTLFGGATYGSGSSGAYINFDGVDDYGDIPYDSGINLSKFSILAWVYLNAAPDNYDAVLSRGYPNTINYYLDCRPSPGYGSGFEFGWYSDIAPTNAKNVIGTTNPTSTVGSWRMVTGTYDGSRLQLFLNGVLEAENTGNTWDNRTSTTGITVGCIKLGGTPNRHTNMRLGMIALYNRGLEPSEVYANFQSTRSRFGVLT